MFLFGLGAAIGGGVVRFIIANITTGTDHTQAVQDGLMGFLYPVATGLLVIGLILMMVSLALTAWGYFVYLRDQ